MRILKREYKDNICTKKKKNINYSSSELKLRPNAIPFTPKEASKVSLSSTTSYASILTTSKSRIETSKEVNESLVEKTSNAVQMKDDTSNICSWPSLVASNSPKPTSSTISTIHNTFQNDNRINFPSSNMKKISKLPKAPNTRGESIIATRTKKKLCTNEKSISKKIKIQPSKKTNNTPMVLKKNLSCNVIGNSKHTEQRKKNVIPSILHDNIPAGTSHFLFKQKNTSFPVSNTGNSSNNDFVLKKGKQRIAPMKKHFTTLKKKILQERLQKWNELQNIQATTFNNSVSNDNNVNNKFIIKLNNVLTEDDLEDEECFEETLKDITIVARKLGQFFNIEFDRRNKGQVFVTYQGDLLSQNKVLNEWLGTIFSGKNVEASILSNIEHKFIIQLNNVLTEDDLEDDECFEETQKDMNDVARQFGQFLNIEFDRRNKGQVFVTYQGDLLSENKVLNEWLGTIFCGKKVEASILSNIEDTFIIQLNNVLTEDDLEDEECFEEIQKDITDVARQLGHFLNIEFGRRNKCQVFVTYQGNSMTQNKVLNEWLGTVFSGKNVEASIVTNIEDTFIIQLNNVLTEDDLEDKDCFEETQKDITDVARLLGHFLNIEFDRTVTNKGQVFVIYQGGLLTQNKVLNEWLGTVFSGKNVEASIVTNVENKFIIQLNNVLTEDDLEDDECFEETQNDVNVLAKKIGNLLNIKFEREGINKGLIFITYKGSTQNEKAVLKSWSETIISGNQVIATLVNNENIHNDYTVQLKKTVESSSVSSEHDNQIKKNTPSSVQQKPELMFSGKKVIPERFAACKRVPKIPCSGCPREYSSLLNEQSAVTLTIEMLSDLMKFQQRGKDDTNARSRRRLVFGLREVARSIRANKVKMVIMANNLDEYGALDAKLQEILNLSKQNELPIIFELNKRRLGKAIGKTIKVSVVGVQNADGAHEKFKKLKKFANKRCTPVE